MANFLDTFEDSTKNGFESWPNEQIEADPIAWILTIFSVCPQKINTKNHPLFIGSSNNAVVNWKQSMIQANKMNKLQQSSQIIIGKVSTATTITRDWSEKS